MNGAEQSASRQSSPDCPCSPSEEGHRTSSVKPLGYTTRRGATQTPSPCAFGTPFDLNTMLRKLATSVFLICACVCTAESSMAESKSNKFWGEHPAGCEHIERRDENGSWHYYFVAPCSRDSRTWEKQLHSVRQTSQSTIFVPGQDVGMYGTIQGYFCSASTIPANASISICVSDGWRAR
jgi:hypothetical protein